MKTLSTNNAQTRVCITQNKNSIRLSFNHYLVALIDDITHSRAKVIAYCLHVDLRIGIAN